MSFFYAEKLNIIPTKAAININTVGCILENFFCAANISIPSIIDFTTNKSATFPVETNLL